MKRSYNQGNQFAKKADDDKKACRIHMYVKCADKKKWDQIAKRQGMSLSYWIDVTCNNMADKELFLLEKSDDAQ